MLVVVIWCPPKEKQNHFICILFFDEKIQWKPYLCELEEMFVKTLGFSVNVRQEWICNKPKQSVNIYRMT